MSDGWGWTGWGPYLVGEEDTNVRAVHPTSGPSEYPVNVAWGVECSLTFVVQAPETLYSTLNVLTH